MIQNIQTVIRINRLNNQSGKMTKIQWICHQPIKNVVIQLAYLFDQLSFYSVLANILEII